MLACQEAPQQTTLAPTARLWLVDSPQSTHVLDLNAIETIELESVRLVCSAQPDCGATEGPVIRLWEDTGVVTFDGTQLRLHRFVGSISSYGRPGGGPGEYREVGDVRMHTNRLRVLDLRRWRVIQYAADGGVIDEVSITPRAGAEEVALAGDGAVGLAAVRSDSGHPGALELAWWTSRESSEPPLLSLRRNRDREPGFLSIAPTQRLVGGRVRLSACNDGSVVFGHSDDDGFFFSESSGSTEFRLRNLVRRPVDASRRDSIRAEIEGRARRYGGAGLAPGFREVIQSAVDSLPRFMPPVAGLWCVGTRAFVVELDAGPEAEGRLLLFWSDGSALVQRVPVRHRVLDITSNWVLLMDDAEELTMLGPWR